jgi:hypothetical protein
MSDNLKKLRLYEDVFNADGMTDENSLANALLTQPDVLSPVITHLSGREDKRFPLSFLTEGMGNVKYINDVEYDYPVMGRLNKSVLCVDASTNITPQGGTVTFADRWFVKNYIIEFGDTNNTQVRIVGDPVQSGAGWKYNVELVSSEMSDSVTGSDLTGKQAVQLFAANAFSGSRGNESNWVAPSKMRNQISLIRKSYRYEGNMPDRVVNFEFNVGGRSTNLWYDFEEYQHMLRWKEECELALWYSRYNRDSNGLIHLRDENGKAIPLGSGVIEQIPNVDTYSVLTAQKLKGVVRDALYGASDASQMNIVLFTGLGGMEEFDNAMKDELASQQYIKNTDPSSFVGGSGRNLSLGGFFTQYTHIDGHTITVRHLPLFDHGARALASDRHPVTGLPMESYRMIFLDMSTYDGQNNVSMITRKNRELVRWAVAGATVPPGFGGNALRATDVDGSAVHFLKECGISIRRATNCLHLECIRS